MQTKLVAVLAAEAPTVDVSRLCRELGIGRSSLYKYRRLWRQGGEEALAERSRRPRHTPHMTPAWLEDEIVRLRKELVLDNGAATIYFHLQRRGIEPPAVSTIYRVLRRRGLIVDEPKKKPRRAWRRFEWPRPNDCWQMDATEWSLARGTRVWIMSVLDDCSRFVPASRALTTANGDGAWETFMAAAADNGLPGANLNDNGLCFSGKLRGVEVEFERNLRALGVRPIVSGPYHPQTCGKIERWQQTLKRWLDLQRRARSLAELNGQLDAFLAFYNHERPHRALRGRTPAERYFEGERGGPAGHPLASPPRISRLKVSRLGQFRIAGHQVGLGKAWAGQVVTAVAYLGEVHVFDGASHVRSISHG